MQAEIRQDEKVLRNKRIVYAVAGLTTAPAFVGIGATEFMAGRIIEGVAGLMIASVLGSSAIAGFRENISQNKLD